jgi:GH24 family phage-related lysozyme (muramidase)
MRAVVIEHFAKWSQRFEGRIPHMYQDRKGLVTIAVGNLIDPVQQAVRLPFRRHDCSLALMSEIQAEWTVIKSNSKLAKAGHAAAAKLCKLHIDDTAIDDLVVRKLQENWAWMRARYWSGCDEWPACAQLAVSSMAWAVGAGFPSIFKTFQSLAKKHDWTGCAVQSHIKAPGDKSIERRNEANRQLLMRAAEQTPEEYNQIGYSSTEALANV